MYRNLPPLMIETGQASQAPATRYTQHATDAAHKQGAVIRSIQLKLAGPFRRDRTIAPAITTRHTTTNRRPATPTPTAQMGD